MPVSLPVGDVLRSIFKGGWFGALLRRLKGVVTRTPGGTEILLDRDGEPVSRGPYRPGESPLDRTPHRPGPSISGPRR